MPITLSTTQIPAHIYHMSCSCSCLCQSRCPLRKYQHIYTICLVVVAACAHHVVHYANTSTYIPYVLQLLLPVPITLSTTQIPAHIYHMSCSCSCLCPSRCPLRKYQHIYIICLVVVAACAHHVVHYANTSTYIPYVLQL